ncbi:fluoride efflux transporter CrcB [Paracidovorax sp. MALMAid1276]|uniref:fluoride efflux transporter CrcB n=1 Tax=Paracidovorax sp. MALMAid1276 TaxID=3411631 RepID=UPI003B9B4023
MLHILAICLGASAGALLRWRLGLWLSPGGVLPWGTLAANLAGGYLVGLCVAFFHAMPQLDPVWRLALVTGFLGALTTFSSFSAEVVEMLMAQRYTVALGTVGLHLAGSLCLTALGIATYSTLIATKAS